MLSLEDLRRNYSLPAEVFAALKDRQIQQLLFPQEAALKAGVLDGKSILLASGSSTGKTLVAEFAIAKLSASRKALYLVPLKSIADDKYDGKVWRQ